MSFVVRLLLQVAFVTAIVTLAYMTYKYRKDVRKRRVLLGVLFSALVLPYITAGIVKLIKTKKRRKTIQEDRNRQTMHNETEKTGWISDAKQVRQRIQTMRNQNADPDVIRRLNELDRRLQHYDNRILPSAIDNQLDAIQTEPSLNQTLKLPLRHR